MAKNNKALILLYLKLPLLRFSFVFITKILNNILTYHLKENPLAILFLFVLSKVEWILNVFYNGPFGLRIMSSF